MRYTQNKILLLEPEHEEIVIDKENVEISVEPVRVKLGQRIHSDQNPFITYWEVEYLSMTPNHDVGETRVMTENMISNNIVPEVTMEKSGDSNNKTDNLLAEPNKEDEAEIDGRR